MTMHAETRDELIGIADGLLTAVIYTGHAEAVRAEQPLVWAASAELMDSPNPDARLTGMALALDTLLESPVTLLSAAQALRERLREEATV